MKTTLLFGEDTKNFFRESLREALTERKIETYPQVEAYLVEVLNHYLLTANLFDEELSSGKRTRETLAEMMLKAGTLPQRQRYDLLKKLGDGALYISGFFSDSFQRKIIDVDYYIDMGASAYDSLSREVIEDTTSLLYREIALKFNLFVDAFMFMSRKTMSGDGNNVFRLMEIHVKTGSSFAQDLLVEKGIYSNPQSLKSAKNQ